MSDAPDRSTYLGGSDIAALLGCNPHKTPMQVFLAKTGRLDLPADSEPVRWGNLLEGVIADEYALREGVALEPSRFVRGPAEFLGGTPDRFVAGQPVGVEVKTAGLRLEHLWGDQEDAVPMHYLVQCQWYLALTDMERWDLPVLIGGQELRIYRLRPDAELAGQLLELASRWWRDHVVAGRPPEMDGHERTRQMLALRYPKNRGPTLDATAEVEGWAEELAKARADREAANAEVERLSNLMRAFIGDADGVRGSTWSATWRATKDVRRVDLDSLRADPAARDLIPRHTRTAPGSRRFVFDQEE